MKKFIGIFAGLIALLAPIYVGIVNFKGFGDAALVFLKGGIMWVLMLVGLAALIIGFTSLKD